MICKVHMIYSPRGPKRWGWSLPTLQVQTDPNFEFVLSYLATFAADLPSKLEVQAGPSYIVKKPLLVDTIYLSLKYEFIMFYLTLLFITYLADRVGVD